jgi:hypothetical protein
MAKAPTCAWVLIPASAPGGDVHLSREAKYCGERCSHTMERGDDGFRRRKYNTFCDRHQAIADAEESE